MKRDTILRKLREFQPPVPLDKAKAIAAKYGDESGIPTPTQALQKEIAKAKRKQAVEQHRREFRTWCRGNGLPLPVPEYQFARESMRRGWLFDWAWPDADPHVNGAGVALEIQGGIWRKGGGAHQGKGHLRDMEKLNAAQRLGWIVLQVTPQQIYSDATLHVIREALAVPRIRSAGTSGEVPASGANPANANDLPPLPPETEP